MVNKILSLSNLEKAYWKIADDMESDGRFGRYRGWDNWKLDDVETHLAETLNAVRDELITFQPLSPAILFKIPKKNNPQKLREIYIYNFKERVKAQAIYQIIEPIFDRYFSNNLFSYRASHPSYLAARSAVRHYLRYWSRDTVFVGDISDYSNYIRHDELKSEIAKLDLHQDIKKWLDLFIGNQVIREGRIVKPDYGLVQGVPLIALFNNIYLDSFDKHASSQIDFYRRVGDDFIGFNRYPESLVKLKLYLEKETARLGLKINQRKTIIAGSNQSFNFLGYFFNEGKISLPLSFRQELIKDWRRQFSYFNCGDSHRKQRFLKNKINRGHHSLREQFQQLAEQKKLVNDDQQLHKLSVAFLRVLTCYFFKTYSARNRRLLDDKLKKISLPSLYKYFSNVKR